MPETAISFKENALQDEWYDRKRDDFASEFDDSCSECDNRTPSAPSATISRRRVFGQSSVVTWGDWSREWSSTGVTRRM